MATYRVSAGYEEQTRASTWEGALEERRKKVTHTLYSNYTFKYVAAVSQRVSMVDSEKPSALFFCCKKFGLNEHVMKDTTLLLISYPIRTIINVTVSGARFPRENLFVPVSFHWSSLAEKSGRWGREGQREQWEMRCWLVTFMRNQRGPEHKLHSSISAMVLRFGCNVHLVRGKMWVKKTIKSRWRLAGMIGRCWE